MAHYKRIALAGHAPQRPHATARRRPVRSPFPRQPMFEDYGADRPSPMRGFIFAIPMGIASWAALGGAAVIIANLVG